VANVIEIREWPRISWRILGCSPDSNQSVAKVSKLEGRIKAGLFELFARSIPEMGEHHASAETLSTNAATQRDHGR
jgi:hypothetical protein